MYSAGHFSKSSSKSTTKDRKESNAGHGSGGHGHGSGAGARKAAQQNRAKHRAEFEMQVGMASHPIKSAPKAATHHSGTAIQQSQPSSRRRRKSSGKGVAYICFGLLGGFFVVTGALLMAFGFTSDEFSWTSPSVGMILAYAGVGIFFTGLLCLFICIIMCCRDRKRKTAEQRKSEEAHIRESGLSGKQNNNRPNQHRELHTKRTGQQDSGKKGNSHVEHINSKNGGNPRKVTGGRPLPTTPISTT